MSTYKANIGLEQRSKRECPSSVKANIIAQSVDQIGLHLSPLVHSCLTSHEPPFLPLFPLIFLLFFPLWGGFLTI